jgi:hypothetical protein
MLTLVKSMVSDVRENNKNENGQERLESKPSREMIIVVKSARK